MNRARMVVSRSGYSTLMELAEVGRIALLVPTAGQSEREYLSADHEQLGTMYSVRSSGWTSPEASSRQEAIMAQALSLHGRDGQ